MLQSLALRELPNLQELVGSHKHCGLRVLNHTIFYPFTAAQGQAILVKKAFNSLPTRQIPLGIVSLFVKIYDRESILIVFSNIGEDV